MCTCPKRQRCQAVQVFLFLKTDVLHLTSSVVPERCPHKTRHAPFLGCKIGFETTFVSPVDPAAQGSSPCPISTMGSSSDSPGNNPPLPTQNQRRHAIVYARHARYTRKKSVAQHIGRQRSRNYSKAHKDCTKAAQYSPVQIMYRTFKKSLYQFCLQSPASYKWVHTVNPSVVLRAGDSVDCLQTSGGYSTSS